jgi:uncharacterized membrane protein YsdA (DUF1294 family)/cold shock CspA family protein
MRKLRFQGKLINWNDDKGFGFVEPNGGGARSFVHIKSFQTRSKRPVEGDLIVYEQVNEARGKCKAVNVSLVRDRKSRAAKPKRSNKLGSLILGIFCLVLISLTLLKLLPIEVLYFYAGASTLTFIVYAYDKSSAKNRRWRTPEGHLHLLALLGGWPGAFYAQNKLRHKSSKKEFKKVYWLTVVINICAFVWLIGEQGQQFLKAIVA